MRQTTRFVAQVGAFASVVLAGAGCDQDVWPDPDPGPSATVGYLTAAVPFPGAGRDVTAVRVDIVAGDAACDGTAIASTVIDLASTGEDPMGSASTGLIVLPAGAYKTCATPLAGAYPSMICARAEAPVTVVAGQTAEVLLISQCAGNPTGAVGATVALNDPPQISAVSATPGRSITVCDSATLSASAVDPDGDAMTFTWSGAMGTRVRPTGSSTAAFSAPAAGDYQVQVVVADARGGQASLSFLMHVGGAVCSAPAAVQALIDAKCSPCHTVNAAGGLKMDTATATFANLVGVSALGAGCTDRTRVVAGNPAGSYLMAKVEHRMDICGMPMPRGRPMLLPAEIQVLSDWIAGLPH
jgi:hypothetical protein